MLYINPIQRYVSYWDVSTGKVFTPPYNVRYLFLISRVTGYYVKCTVVAAVYKINVCGE